MVKDLFCKNRINLKMSNKSIVNNIVSEHDVMVNQFNLCILRKINIQELQYLRRRSPRLHTKLFIISS